MQKYTDQLQKILNEYSDDSELLILSRALQDLQSDIGAELAMHTGTKSIGEATNKRIKDLSDGKGTEKIITGFTDLDRTSGWYTGELIVIGGRPGMGKTSLMVNVAVNIARERLPVLYATLDLAEWQLADRFMSHICKLDVDNFNEVPQPFTENAAKLAVSELNVLPVHLAADNLFNTDVLVACIRKAVNEKKIKVVFIDYLQLLGNISRRMNREAELAGITRALKNIAKELKICIVASSQLSRAVENRPGGSKRPQLSDLRESGAIEQDADKVLFLYRAEYYGLEVDENNEPTADTMEIIIAKNKSGPIGTIKLLIEPRFTGFMDYVEPRLKIPGHWLNDDR